MTSTFADARILILNLCHWLLKSTAQASVSVNKLIQDLASTAAERSYTPYHVLLFYWRRRISFTLQYYNAWIVNQAYLKLNNCGGGNIHRDLELDNIF